MHSQCLYCYLPLEHGEQDFHARCSRKFFGSDEPPQLNYTLNEMADLAANVVQRSISVPGVQPKLSLSLVKEVMADGDKGRLTIVGALGGSYILKPPHPDYPEMPQNEHATMRIAEASGLPVVPSSLVRLSSGELAYVTRRIDRTEKGEKTHMLDMFQVLEAFDKYKGSMEKVGKALVQYSETPLLDLSYFFDLTLFCFLTGNSDMHLKNFSMILGKDGWVMAPAYDLLNVAIVNPDDKEELALTLNAKKSKFTREIFREFGKQLGLNERQVSGAFRRLESMHAQARNILPASFLSQESREKYGALLEERFARLIG